MLDNSDFSAAAFRPGQTGTLSAALGHKTIRVTAAETGGRVSVFDAVIAPGEGPPLHVHMNEDETFHVISGALRIWCGEESFEAGPGATAVLPRGVPHRFSNEGDVPAHAIVQCTPGGFEGFFLDLDAMTAPAPADIVSVAARYGVEFLPG